MAQYADRGMSIVRIRHRPPDGHASRIVTLNEGVLTETRMNDQGHDQGNGQKNDQENSREARA